MTRWFSRKKRSSFKTEGSQIGALVAVCSSAQGKGAGHGQTDEAQQVILNADTMKGVLMDIPHAPGDMTGIWNPTGSLVQFVGIL